jgi:hypothetical protein
MTLAIRKRRARCRTRRRCSSHLGAIGSRCSASRTPRAAERPRLRRAARSASTRRKTRSQWIGWASSPRPVQLGPSRFCAGGSWGRRCSEEGQAAARRTVGACPRLHQP